MKPYTLFAWALGLLVFISGCSRNPVTGKREVMFMSEAQEIALGKKSDPSIVAAYGKYDDPALQKFIDEKGQAMAAISHRPNLKYEFKILDSPVVNAFALPGGYVYFTRGIMAHFNNEAEFAGVLGHETGHITARHSAKQSRNQLLGNIAFIGGVLVSEDFRRYAQQAQQGLGLLFRKFSRDHERESDELGVAYSSEIGYDAVQMAEFFKTLSRLSEKRGQNIPTFMSTHPDPGNRYHDVRSHAHEHQSKHPEKEYKINRNEYLRRIDGIVYGDDPKQGFFENNHFYHPELKFEFAVPSQWQTKNTPSNVQMAPKDGKCLITFALAQGQNAQSAAEKFATDNKLQVQQSAQENVNGLPGYAFIATQPQQNQQTGQTTNLKLLCYFIEYNNIVYLFSGVAQEANFDSYFNTFRQVMVSFKPLTDPDKLNRKPMVVRIVEAKQTAPLSTQLQTYSMPSHMNLDLSILNGMELTETVEKGKLFKIVKYSDGSRVPTSTSTYPNTPGGGAQPKANVPTQPSTVPGKPGTIKPKPKGTTKKGSSTKNKVIKLKKID